MEMGLCFRATADDEGFSYCVAQADKEGAPEYNATIVHECILLTLSAKFRPLSHEIAHANAAHGGEGLRDDDAKEHGLSTGEVEQLSV